MKELIFPLEYKCQRIYGIKQFLCEAFWLKQAPVESVK